MRATRAYIAGFGTAGSLLAGAAIMFFLASAVVSFRGWPQVGAQATPVAVSAGRLRAPRSSPPVRQFVALASAQTASVAHAGAAGTGPTGRLGSRHNATAIVAATPIGSGASHPASFVSSSPSTSGTSAPPTTPPCSTCGRPTLGGVTQAATNTLGTTVAATGTQLGSVVSGLTGAVAGQLGALNPKLSQVVSGTGQALGGTVSSATAALGSTLSGVGRGLSGLLARHP